MRFCFLFKAAGRSYTRSLLSPKKKQIFFVLCVFLPFSTPAETQGTSLFDTYNPHSEKSPGVSHQLTIRDHFPQYRVYFSEKKILREAYKEFLEENPDLLKKKSQKVHQ